MDKKICAVVQDLLVLYEDDVLGRKARRWWRSISALARSAEGYMNTPKNCLTSRY